MLLILKHTFPSWWQINLCIDIRCTEAQGIARRDKRKRAQVPSHDVTTEECTKNQRNIFPSCDHKREREQRRKTHNPKSICKLTFFSARLGSVAAAAANAAVVVAAVGDVVVVAVACVVVVGVAAAVLEMNFVHLLMIR